MSDVLALRTASGPLDATVAVPGSKSIANRALVCAALAEGASELTGLPPGDDTAAMLRSLSALGTDLSTDGTRAVVHGTGGVLTAGPVHLHAALAGTTSRFVTAVAALAEGPVTVDGAAQLRVRPMHPLHEALRTLGAIVTHGEVPGRLPVTIRGPLPAGGRIAMPGDVSSQFLTALMLVAPLLRDGLRIDLTTPLVSAPYIGLTAAVMAAFGVTDVEVADRAIVVAEGRYRGTAYAIEPDASSAGYPLAMAAVAGGRVQVLGLTSASQQGDVAVTDLLVGMGCAVVDDPAGLIVERHAGAPLRGLDVDMAATSDLVPTIAVVATMASTPTTIHGVGFIRRKESDRLGDLAIELVKTGARVTVETDGLLIDPVLAPLRHGAVLETHDDHRLAMAFGVLATVVEGIRVTDPGVVSKSWPDFWSIRDAVVGLS